MPVISTSKIKAAAEAKKQESDRLHGFLQEMLREEENKYCADCEQKQPRWASWNLGVFLCIRCAGLHRNLGVHISKVKSVTLDSWTAEQVQSMRVMGNAKARAVYEAELPTLFRRPQTDQSLEQFIRAKYEAKRYLMKDWVPPAVNVSDLPAFPDEKKLLATGNHIPERHGKGSIIKKTAIHPRSVGEIANGSKQLTSTNQQAQIQQLIDLSFTHTPQESIKSDVKEINATNIDDLFGPIVSAVPSQQQAATLSLSSGMPISVSSPNLSTVNIRDTMFSEKINDSNFTDQIQVPRLTSNLSTNPATVVSSNQPGSNIDSDLLGLDLSFCSVSGSSAQNSSYGKISQSNSIGINDAMFIAPSAPSDTKKSTNEILALFNK